MVNQSESKKTTRPKDLATLPTRWGFAKTDDC